MIDEKYDIVGQATRNIKQILAIISEEKRWYTILEISERSDMITRTVQRYIHELDARIRNFNDDNIQLLVTKNKGVFLELHPGADLSGFSLFLLEDNITIDLLKSLFFENFHSVKKFAYDNFMSETTL
ncbi:helix-turn-helix domain-containing protein [Carnobacterium maltaromaticum]|uniref:helix-turn-helix domain-containing protein n=1 Tax=Carnobacterium maltaromaticum TaxID=2751 RepID=UPI0039AF3D69